MTENPEKLTGENLLFVVGSPRSGTTWLQRLLATHPRIKTGQESHLFEYIGPQLRLWEQNAIGVKSGGRDAVGMACYLTAEEFFRAQKGYLGAMMKPMLDGLGPGEVFLEKTPGHALFIPEIIRLLPRARFIHIIRDPRDTVASLLAASRGWGRGWAPKRARNAARTWCQHVSQARAAGRKLPADQFMEVSYEQLLADPAGELARMRGFLKLEWAESGIQEAIRLNSAAELRQGKGTPLPLRGEAGRLFKGPAQDPEGFVRKARAATWKEDLSLWERCQIRWTLRNSADARAYLKR